MQLLYGSFEDETVHTDGSLKQLNESLKKTEELYYTLLYIAVELCKYADDFKDAKTRKQLASEADFEINTEIAHNPLIEFIDKDAVLAALFKKNKVSYRVEKSVVKKLFELLTAKERYKKYVLIENKQLSDHLNMFAYIFKKVMDRNEDLFFSLDDDFINLSDDFHTLNFLLQKATEIFDETSENNFLFRQSGDKVDIEFTNELLKLCLQNKEELMQKIEPKLINWDTDRIAHIDLIILQMAVCEFKFFSDIPVKVTINEYIEIAKGYSTPKSKDFINGVLDKLLIDMKKSGEIVKKGRGLLEH